jgi:uncharacterized protein (TIGR00106 family)
MAVMDIQVSPRRRDTISVSDAVAEAHRVIEKSGLRHVLHPMGTCIEGPATQLYALAAEIHAALAAMGYERIGVQIKVDDRLDKQQSMSDKVRRVNELLN